MAGYKPEDTESWSFVDQQLIACAHHSATVNSSHLANSQDNRNGQTQLSHNRGTPPPHTDLQIAGAIIPPSSSTPHTTNVDQVALSVDATTNVSHSPALRLTPNKNDIDNNHHHHRFRSAVKLLSRSNIGTHDRCAEGDDLFQHHRSIFGPHIRPGTGSHNEYFVTIDPTRRCHVCCQNPHVDNEVYHCSTCRAQICHDCIVKKLHKEEEGQEYSNHECRSRGSPRPSGVAPHDVFRACYLERTVKSRGQGDWDDVGQEGQIVNIWKDDITCSLWYVVRTKKFDHQERFDLKGQENCKKRKLGDGSAVAVPTKPVHTDVMELDNTEESPKLDIGMFRRVHGLQGLIDDGGGDGFIDRESRILATTTIAITQEAGTQTFVSCSPLESAFSLQLPLQTGPFQAPPQQADYAVASIENPRLSTPDTSSDLTIFTPSETSSGGWSEEQQYPLPGQSFDSRTRVFSTQHQPSAAISPAPDFSNLDHVVDDYSGDDQTEAEDFGAEDPNRASEASLQRWTALVEVASAARQDFFNNNNRNATVLPPYSNDEVFCTNELYQPPRNIDTSVGNNIRVYSYTHWSESNTEREPETDIDVTTDIDSDFDTVSEYRGSPTPAQGVYSDDDTEEEGEEVDREQEETDSGDEEDEDLYDPTDIKRTKMNHGFTKNNSFNLIPNAMASVICTVRSTGKKPTTTQKPRRGSNNSNIRDHVGGTGSKVTRKAKANVTHDRKITSAKPRRNHKSRSAFTASNPPTATPSTEHNRKTNKTMQIDHSPKESAPATEIAMPTPAIMGRLRNGKEFTGLHVRRK